MRQDSSAKQTTYSVVGLPSSICTHCLCVNRLGGDNRHRLGSVWEDCVLNTPVVASAGNNACFNCLFSSQENRSRDVFVLHFFIAQWKCVVRILSECSHMSFFFTFQMPWEPFHAPKCLKLKLPQTQFFFNYS